MIEVTLTGIDYSGTVHFREDKGEVRIIVTGHGNYGPKGTDIVCAAASVLSQTLVMSISQMTSLQQKITQRDGHLESIIATDQMPGEEGETLKSLLGYFCIGILELQHHYPDHLSLTIEG